MRSLFRARWETPPIFLTDDGFLTHGHHRSEPNSKDMCTNMVCLHFSQIVELCQALNCIFKGKMKIELV
jgi:hypothetical protein